MTALAIACAPVATPESPDNDAARPASAGINAYRMIAGLDPLPDGICGCVISSDDWGWSLVACTKRQHENVLHISEGNTTFGLVPFTAIWQDGDERAERWFDRGAVKAAGFTPYKKRRTRARS